MMMLVLVLLSLRFFVIKKKKCVAAVFINEVMNFSVLLFCHDVNTELMMKFVVLVEKDEKNVY